MDNERLSKIYETIKKYKKIAIHTHGRPDGDAVGTAKGLQDIILTTWPDKEVVMVGETNDFTSFIGLPDEVDDSFFEGALSICVDTANQDRVHDQRFKQSETVIKIDHHIPVDSYGDIEYVDTSRPAAALIILDLLVLHSDTLNMSPAGANALYFGILTDTGRFKYSGVNKITFERVSVLFDYGLDTKPIYQYMDQRTEEVTRFRGFLLQHYKITENGVAYFKILPEYLDKFNVSLEEATSLVNDLGVLKGVPIWLLFAEYEEQIVRARMRSKGPAIDTLANQFDGGGHAMACGANLGTWDKADKLIEASDKLAKEYKESLSK